MRAGRVISLLFTLQQHGRMTAGELAAQLEVSVRTILRDVETLSGAGVPVYTVQGAGGGIELLDGFRSSLTGLTAEESAALFLTGQPELAAVLGLGPAAGAARRKLLLALPPSSSQSVLATDDWFLHDPLGREPAPENVLRLIARAIQAHVEVRRTGTTIRPLALILEAGKWHVVVLEPDGPRLRSLIELTSSSAQELSLGKAFTRPDVFELADFWNANRAAGT